MYVKNGGIFIEFEIIPQQYFWYQIHFFSDFNGKYAQTLYLNKNIKWSEIFKSERIILKYRGLYVKNGGFFIEFVTIPLQYFRYQIHFFSDFKENNHKICPNILSKQEYTMVSTVLIRKKVYQKI